MVSVLRISAGIGLTIDNDYKISSARGFLLGARLQNVM